MRLARVAATATTALVIGSLTTAPASAATTFGSTDFAPASGPCTVDQTVLQGAPPSGTTYSAPSSGVITQWKFRATDAAQVKFKLLRFVSGNDYTVVASSDTVSVTAGTTGAFAARIPTQAGDVLGITSKSTACVATVASGALAFVAASDVAAGSSATFSASPMTAIPVSATLEADADGDGYGDETQDGCPSNPATHGSCPLPPGTGVPNTKVTSGPTSTTKSTVKYTFVSTVAGATFECKLKGKGVTNVKDKRYQACTSPRKYKKLTPGSYTFFVRATTAAGTDKTPAKVKLEVKPKKK